MNLDPDFGPIYGSRRALPGNRVAYVAPLVFGRARLMVGEAGDTRFADDAY